MKTFGYKADKFLEEFYASVGAITSKQKLVLLQIRLGEYCFSHDPTTEQMVGALEYDLLIEEGLYTPTYA